ncbi:MAG: IclR family transcriptional regulator [Anaerolineales bacterium]|nr:IclR family transcriptional regulator [Anaerolineales bacterium]
MGNGYSESSVKTVDRLVRVLDSFSSDKLTWSLADLSNHLDIPKSTLHRFLVSLEQHGILRRDPTDKSWRLGYRLVGWGSLAKSSTGLNDLARPFMRQIAKATGETVALTVYADKEVLCIEKIEALHSVRLALDVGGRRLPHAGASAKILMAFLSRDEIQDIIENSGLPKLGDNTITDPDELEAELEKIRTQGYAVSIEETDPGSWGVATPILDRNREIVAAIGVAGPIQRYSDSLLQQYLSECRKASQEISKLLGFVHESSDDT